MLKSLKRHCNVILIKVSIAFKHILLKKLVKLGFSNYILLPKKFKAPNQIKFKVTTVYLYYMHQKCFKNKYFCGIIIYHMVFGFNKDLCRYTFILNNFLQNCMYQTKYSSPSGSLIELIFFLLRINVYVLCIFSVAKNTQYFKCTFTVLSQRWFIYRYIECSVQLHYGSSYYFSSSLPPQND